MHHSHHHEANVASSNEPITIESCRVLSSIDEIFWVRVLSLVSVALAASSIRPGKAGTARENINMYNKSLEKGGELDVGRESKGRRELIRATIKIFWGAPQPGWTGKGKSNDTKQKAS